MRHLPALIGGGIALTCLGSVAAVVVYTVKRSRRTDRES